MDYKKRLISLSQSMRNIKINNKNYNEIKEDISNPETETVETLETVETIKVNNIINNRILLVKGSSFYHINNNNLNYLYEDCIIDIQGKVVIDYFGSNILIDNGTTSDIKILDPILDVNGFGVKSTGSYNIRLNSSSNIKVQVGNTVFLLGTPNVKITLNNDLIGKYSYKMLNNGEPEIKIDPPIPQFIEHSKVILTKDILLKLQSNK
jgi:hypothetical protein